MARSILGLHDDEQAVYDTLVAQLQSKEPRNTLRQKFMDGKQSVRALSPMLPPYLRRAGAVLGWPAKACEAVNRRARLEGFDLPKGDLSRWGLDQIMDDNDYLLQVRQTEMASLVHAVSWEIVVGGDTSLGEPDVMIVSKTALEATGTWNKRARRLDNFLSVSEWTPSGDPKDFTLYMPGLVITVQDGAVVDESKHNLWIPANPVVYRPSLEHPFGKSRLSRPVMFLTGAAVRALLRMEGTADFYGTPHLLLMGALMEQFQGADGKAASTWDFLMSKINGIPDDDDAVNPRAEVVQVQQASQQPHLDSIDEIAAAFAGETNIPVSALGVGVKQANPTSSESYEASREDLISEAEDAQDTWGGTHVKTLQMAWMFRTGSNTLPPQLRKLQPRWRDARRTSRAAAADSSSKLIAAFPWMAESATMLENVGFDKATTERLKAELETVKADKAKAAAKLAATPPPTIIMAGGAPAQASGTLPSQTSPSAQPGANATTANSGT